MNAKGYLGGKKRPTIVAEVPEITQFSGTPLATSTTTSAGEP